MNLTILNPTILHSILLITLLMTIPSETTAEEQLLYIGTAKTGIYSCTLNTETGELSETKLAVEAPKPGFLALHPGKQFLYAVTNEDANPAGGVRAFAIERKTGTLKSINNRPSGDDGATHLEVTRDGKAIVVSHYSGGSTSALPINDDGSIGEMNGFIRHEGSGPNKGRQEKAHAHGSAIGFDGRFVCIADLGTDEIQTYKLTDNAGLEKVSVWKSAPGAGPRHMMFHPNQKWLYCINELDSTINVLDFDKQTGAVTSKQVIPTLPEDFDGANGTAELAVTPDGKFLYGSNRGHDSTAAYKINQEDGTLALIEIEPTQGGHPRFIGVDLTGKLFIAANRDSDNLVSFRIDQETGSLTPTGHQTSAPSPICIVFLK